MKDEPEIIKILRREEKLGILQGKSQYSYENIQLPKESFDDISEKTIMLEEEALEKKKDIIEHDAIYNIYKIIFENTSFAITIADERERIISWNKHAEELLNMKEKDLFMIPVKELYPPEEWKKIRAENVRQKGIKYRMETKILKKDKGPIDVEISLCTLKGPSEKNVGSIGIIKDISELKKIQSELIESEERYRTIFENSAVAITLTDEKERIISWNKYAEYLLGRDKEDLYLKPVESLYPPEEWRKIRSENVRQKGIQHRLETKILKKNNNLIDVDLSLSVLKNHKGEVIGSIGVIKDISIQKQIKDALEKSEKKFKLLYDRAPVPYHTLSPTGIITNVNEKWCQILGYTKKEVVGKSIFDFVSKNEQKAAKTSFEKKIQNKKSYSMANERTYITKDGKKRIFVIHDFFSFDNHNNVRSVHTVMEDISERKKSEEALKESEKKYRMIFELSPEAVVLIDKKGTILDANERIFDWLGFKPEKIIGNNLIELPFFSKDSKVEVKEKFTARMQGKKIPPYELDFINKNGEKRIGRVYGNQIRDEDKKIIGDLVAISNITQQKQVWDKMVKSEEKYRVLAETSADGVFSTDILGRLTYVNPSLEKILGRRKSKILATLFRDYLSESSVYLFQQAMLEAQKNNKKVENVELDVIHYEGYEIPIEANIAPLKKDGKFIGIQCTVRDVSERERIVRELKKSENLRTEFMNIVAHELKSPVTPIKGYLDLIASDKDIDENVKNWARIGLRNAERLLRLVNDILDVSRLDTDTMRFNMEKTDLVMVLNDAAEDIEPAIEKKNLKFNKKIPDKLPKILCDKYRLSQVLKNLLGNAIKFTDYGSITLKAEEEKNHLLITVEDTGIGISNDETKKIFTKFYQAYTGEDRKNEGTGLGLFICKEIIKKHKGSIWAESKVGKGSTFKIKLPI